MSDQSIILIGGPDSGKTNYLARLWMALDAKDGSLIAAEQPEELGFILEVAEHLYSGHFAPRTEHADRRRNFKVIVRSSEKEGNTSILVPDISGELWRDAVLHSEISADWMNELGRAIGALLFVRIGSDQNVRPLDWVTSHQLLRKVGDLDKSNELPTQVMLCELLRFLENTMARRPNSQKPRLSVIVSAWDRVDPATFNQGPLSFLTKEFPLFAGRINNCTALEVKTFGVSVVGGDLKNDEEFRDGFLDAGPNQQGWVVSLNSENGAWERRSDITLPVSWIVCD